MKADITSTRTRPTVYESAIDWWVAAILLMTPVASAVIGVYALWIGQSGDAATMFATGAIVSLITVALTLPCRYTILDDAISIRCGLLCYQVPMDEILSVEPTTSLLSAPALSLKRVAIKTSKRTVIVSPKDREAFIDDLKVFDAAKHELVASPSGSDGL